MSCLERNAECFFGGKKSVGILKEIGIIRIISWRGWAVRYDNNNNNSCPFFSVRMENYSYYSNFFPKNPDNFFPFPSPPPWGFLPLGKRGDWRGVEGGGLPTSVYSLRLPVFGSRLRCCSSRAGSARVPRRGWSSSPVSVGHTPGSGGCSHSTCGPPHCLR